MDSRQAASSTKGSLEIQHNFNVRQVCCVFLSSRTRTLSWGCTAISWLLLPCLSLPLLITSGSNLLFGTLKVKVIVTQLCPILCDHMDCSLPWFSVHGNFLARILEEVAIPFSGEIFPPQGLNPGLLPCRSLYWDQPEKSLWNSGKVMKAGVCSLQTRCSGVLQGLTVFQDHQFSSVQLLSRVLLFVTPWTAAHQASLCITNSWSLLKLMSVESVMPPSHFILCCPLLLLQDHGCC